MSCDPANRTGVVEWPPSTEILEAAGGVGFGDIHLATNADPSTIATEDVIVPPVIRSLHPKLAAGGYERHRRDPLFLYKVRKSSSQGNIAPQAGRHYAFHDTCIGRKEVFAAISIVIPKCTGTIFCVQFTTLAQGELTPASIPFENRRLSFASPVSWSTLNWRRWHSGQLVGRR